MSTVAHISFRPCWFILVRFLLAKLHLDSLAGKRTVKDIRYALKDLPTGIQQLDKAYDQTLARINSKNPDDVKLGKRVFHWLLPAKRPLSAVELQATLAVKIGDTELDEENYVRIDETVALRAGLVAVDIEANIMRLIHYITNEYFRHSGAQWIAETSECIASTCLTYLSLDMGHLGTSDRV